MSFQPPYPKPHKNKSSFFLRFFRGWHSWLDVLFERSYHMKMGKISQPGMNIFMVNEPSLVRNILVKKHKEYPKHQLMHRMLEPLLGNSIFTTNGPVWERQRRLVDMAFAQARLKLVFPLMLASAHDLINRLDKVADEESYEIDPEMTYVTADIIFRTILSESLTSNTAKEIYEAFIAFSHHAQRAMMLMIYRIPPFFSTRASRRPAQKIRHILAEIIARRVAERAAGDLGQYNDILSGLMEAKDPVSGDSFSYEELVDQVCMLFLAGHETSASALSWSIYLISHAPALQQQILDEINEVVGERELHIGDMKQMPIVWNTFREALRLYPPVGFFVREAANSHCLHDKQVHKGDPVLISPWLMHRHRDLWERPDDFDPSRFNTSSGKESLKCAYIPFSKGPRVCIGAGFATQEAILILATLVRRYHIHADHSHIPKPIGRVTIRSSNGIKVRLLRRGIS